MEMNDSVIQNATSVTMMSEDFIYSLLEIARPENRMRMQVMAKLRAKELGIHKEFMDAFKAYNKLDEDLAKEYTKEYAKRNAKIPLDFDGSGKPMTTIENFVRILEGDPKFEGLKFNLLTYSPEQIKDGETREWTDADDAEARRYIENTYKIHSKDKSDDALRIVFSKNEYHPVRDLIDSIEWDGKERIKYFLAKWTNCEVSDYTCEVSRLIFAGGIHRLYHPGCKFDDMPVLIGTKQGEGKSSFVRFIAMRDEFFTEVSEFDGQKGMESLEGAWICEVGELLALTKTKEQEAVKAYLTRLNDRYRMPYDKRVTNHPRQCVFIGTTNKRQFLTDKTGNRRFYPVEVHTVGYELFDRKEELMEDVRQCWAEAKAKMLKGEMPPYANRELVEEIRRRQADAVEDDYRVGMIESYLEGKEEICILDIWRNALGMGEFSKPTKKDSNDISLILQSEFREWEKQPKAKRFPDFGAQKYWKKTNPADKDVKLEPDLPF